MLRPMRWLTAIEAAGLVRSRECSAAELVEAALAEIDGCDRTLGAFTTVVDERALAQAAEVAPGDARPLAGVPVAVKDLTAVTEGVRTTLGSRATGEWIPRRDSTTVARLRAAGAIVVGKTNTPEFGLLPITEPVRFGPTRNPWDRSRTPGGSSGGSAAAVAAGMVPLAHGSDGGGSIRVPAACCGLVGLKPSRGRVPIGPGVPGSALLTEGCLARTVADAALALDVIAATAGAPFRNAADSVPRRLRIAFTATAPGNLPVDGECRSAVERAARLLDDLGHAVEPAGPSWAASDFLDRFVALWVVSTKQDVDGCEDLLGRPVDRALLEPLTAAMLAVAERTPPGEVRACFDRVDEAGRGFLELWERFDVLMTPVLARSPIATGELWAPPDEPLRTLVNGAAFVPFTPAWNVTGQPALSLPLHRTASRLPVGVQLIGPPGGDELLLSLAGEIERAHPWRELRPPAG